MTTIRNFVALVCFSLVLTTTTKADLKLHAVFSDGMVYFIFDGLLQHTARSRYNKVNAEKRNLQGWDDLWLA